MLRYKKQNKSSTKTFWPPHSTEIAFSCLFIFLFVYIEFFYNLFRFFSRIFQIFGLFLAYETRSLKVKQINDSRYVGMSIYNVVILCLITAPVAMVIASQQDASYAFVALAIVFCCFLSMALIFVPKVSVNNTTLVIWNLRFLIRENIFMRSFTFCYCPEACLNHHVRKTVCSSSCGGWHMKHVSMRWRNCWLWIRANIFGISGYRSN